MTDQFVKILLELGASNAQQYRAWKLKERLRKHYGDQLVIVSFDGSTDIICSSAVTLGDASTKASALHDTDEETEYKDIGDAVPPTPLDETQILHTAAGILRKHMDGITCSTDMYAPVADTNIQKCAEFVPDPMYDFVQWCLNDKAYNNLASCSSEDVPKNNLKTIAICHNMISLNQCVFTAITLDLALHFHLGLVVKLRIQSLLSSNLGVTSVTHVFDRYDSDISIKQQERERRAGRDTTPTYVISGRRRVPNYRKFMKNATNKSELAEFICV